MLGDEMVQQAKTLHQAQGPELDTQNPYGERRELAPESCSLSFHAHLGTHSIHTEYTHLHTQFCVSLLSLYYFLSV